MAEIELVEHVITAYVPELGNPDNTIAVPLHVRVDPLTGHTSRLVSGTKLAPGSRPDLAALTAKGGFCPFCAPTIESATGTFPPEITPEGRIRRGSAVVVPNVMAYSEYSSVALYDTQAHFLDLPDLTPVKVGDLLTAATAYTRGVHGLRPGVGMWSSINANYLPPAGSSLIHPHAQTAHDDIGTTTQRQLVQRCRAWPGDTSYLRALVEVERDGDRWIGERGRTAVLTPWAPIGFHEVWAIVPGASDLVDLTDDDCADLGHVLSRVLTAYHSLNLTSFNWALYGGGPAPSERYDVLLRIVSRSNAEAMYRSDVTYFERLHAEAMVDTTPEEVAEVMRAHVGDGGPSRG